MTAIRIHDSLVDATAHRDGRVTVRRRAVGTSPLAIEAGGAAATLPPEAGAEVTLAAD